MLKCKASASDSKKGLQKRVKELVEILALFLFVVCVAFQPIEKPFFVSYICLAHKKWAWILQITDGEAIGY
ncbi:hypothetical protein BBM87_18490 [Vibrio parahaemolyticus]|nr:hypothetical protein BBM87_18490 [Vibrio parahaemolyticus]